MRRITNVSQLAYNAKCIATVAATLLIGCIANLRSNAQPVPVSISWQVPEQEMSLHEPVVLRLLLDNNANDAVNLDLGANFTAGLLITIIRPDGTTVRWPPLEPSDFTRAGKVRIEPGASYIHDFVLNEWYDFESTGRYEIQVTLRFPLLMGNRNILVPHEIRKTIFLKARDEAALYTRCEILAIRAADTRLDEGALIAAEALSYVNDPVAVPFLGRLAKLPSMVVRNTAIRGLARMSTPEAVDALISVVSGTPEEPWARRSLLETAQKTENLELRKHIYTILGEHPTQ